MNPKREAEGAVPEFMTAAEVAAWFRVGVSTIYSWSASGRIPAVKFNGVVRFHRHQVMGWIQQHRMGPAAQPVSQNITMASPRQLTHRTLVNAASRVTRRLLLAKKPMPHGGME